MSDRGDAPSVFHPIAQLVFVAAAAVGVYSFVSVAREGESRAACSAICNLRPTYAGYERRVPNFSLKDIRGHDVSLDMFKGKVIVLNFWTRTCGPCMEEMPDIADLARILKPMPDVVLLTISTDETPQEAIDALKSVLREEAPFPVLMDPESSVVRQKFGTNLFPETWIIDKNGVVRARFDGPREWSGSMVVELIDKIRVGSYCPVTAKGGQLSVESGRLCEAISGG